MDKLDCSLSDRWMYYCGLLAMHGVEVDDLKHIQDLIDAEEQGLIIHLPCKVGATVYLINHNKLEMRAKPIKCIVDEFTMSGVDCYAVLNANEPFYSMRRFKAVNIKNFGKTVFLTKEEAEQALAEMESKNE